MICFLCYDRERIMIIIHDYSRTLSIVTPFWHNAILKKVVIIDRGDYRQGKILIVMSYYANWQREHL
jgi:hypothetical protein